MSKPIHPCIYKDDRLELYLEVTDTGLHFIHCLSNSWSVRDYRHYLEVFANVMFMLGDYGIYKIYAAINNEKLEKFAGMFGFQPDNWSIVDDKGEEREVWVWTR